MEGEALKPVSRVEHRELDGYKEKIPDELYGTKDVYTKEEVEKCIEGTIGHARILFAEVLKSLPRYDININDIDYVQRDLVEEGCSDGEYVKFSDIEKLIKQYERTTKST